MRNRGITLLELLITSVLITLVVIAAYSAFYTGKNGYGLIEKRAEQNQCGRAIIERFAKDVRNSIAYSPKSRGFSGEKDSLSFFLLRDTYGNKSWSRLFSRAGYRYKNGALSIRYRDRQQALDDETTGQYEIFADSLTGCAFSYGSFNADLKHLEWTDTWKRADLLPSAVRITLIFAGSGESFTHEIFLP